MRACVFSLLLSLAPAAAGQQYVISTYAGGAPPPTPILGTDASIGSVLGIAADAQGNVYLASVDYNCVFKLDPGGTLTRVAGNSRPGYSGDGGPATSAKLYLDYGVFSAVPVGVAADHAGNLFIADAVNARIRKVSPDGIITTAAGNGTVGFSGDGGPASAAQLNLPVAVALDGAGNLFISDRGNVRIRKVAPNGIITTVAGGGMVTGDSGDGGPATNAVLGPDGIALDSRGNLFIAEAYHGRIRKVSPDGIITTIAGGGAEEQGDGLPATRVRLRACWGVAVDRRNNLIVTDVVRVRKVSADGIITTLAGNTTPGNSGDGSSATGASFLAFGVAVDAADNLFVLDAGHGRIRRVSPEGIITTVAGNGTFGPRVNGLSFSGDGGPATEARMSWPSGTAVDGRGNVFIADSFNHRVRQVSTSGIITSVAGNGTRGFSGDGGPATDAELSEPIAVAVDGSGNLFILDAGNSRIRQVSPSGTISTVAGNGTRGFSGDGGLAISAALGGFTACNRSCGGVAADTAGNLFIADSNNSRVRKVSPDGIIGTVAGNGVPGFSGDGGHATKAQLRYPAGVAVDGSGNLFIADSGRIRKINADGIITIVAGGGSLPGSSADDGPATAARLSFPSGVAVDGAGSLFIADPGWNFFTDDAPLDPADHRIRKVSPSGIITTIAGNGARGFSGDGGPANSAELAGPAGVAVDVAGNVYVVDSGNHTLRVLRPAGKEN